jgi:hypothetical protein
MPELSTITDPKLPEPKGASSAENLQVYVADGAGGGVWTYLPQGWGFYEHSGAGQVINTGDVQLAINGSGVNSNTSYLPAEIRGSDHLWDTATNFITPIAVGDAYHLRIVLPITAKTGSPNTLTLTLDIGGSTSITQGIFSTVFDATPSVPYEHGSGFPTFVSSDFFNNGCQIFLSTDTGTVTVTNPEIFIRRDFSGDL